MKLDLESTVVVTPIVSVAPFAVIGLHAERSWFRFDLQLDLSKGFLRIGGLHCLKLYFILVPRIDNDRAVYIRNAHPAVGVKRIRLLESLGFVLLDGGSLVR